MRSSPRPRSVTPKVADRCHQEEGSLARTTLFPAGEREGARGLLRVGRRQVGSAVASHTHAGEAHARLTRAHTHAPGQLAWESFRLAAASSASSRWMLRPQDCLALELSAFGATEVDSGRHAAVRAGQLVGSVSASGEGGLRARAEVRRYSYLPSETMKRGRQAGKAGRQAG